MELFPPDQDVQCRVIFFLLAVWLNTGLGMGVFTSPDDCALGPLDPIKEDPAKGIDRLKAGSADRRLEALATLFATIAALPRVLKLTVPSNVILLKTDSRLLSPVKLSQN